ncbi:MAG TPA: GNAT family N-acetyltransferase [Dehalococcoidia bacterium]|nr:GNAT family N-acetyltransferase [Dehalococcoidia bacterium]
MHRDELVARADDNYYAAFRRLAAALDGGEVVESDGMLVIRTGLPVAMFNIAFVTRPLADPPGAVARASAYFDAHGLPFVVRIRAGIDDAAERAAATCGLPYRDTVPGMAMASIPEIPVPPPSLEIRSARDEATLDAHRAVLAESFGMPMDLVRQLLVTRSLEMLDAEFYVGYVDGEPVASSALIASDRTAGVWNVGCRPSHRKRGLGEALTWHAVRRGAEIGCTTANLQASEMGQPIYARMGFQVVAGYRTFVRDGY